MRHVMSTLPREEKGIKKLVKMNMLQYNLFEVLLSKDTNSFVCCRGTALNTFLCATAPVRRFRPTVNWQSAEIIKTFPSENSNAIRRWPTSQKIPLCAITNPAPKYFIGEKNGK